MLLRKLYYRLPIKLRFLVRRLLYLPHDLREAITGRKEELIPPKGLIFTGPGNFKEEGKRLLEQFISFGELAPHEKVLDIGSGIGRAAVPLTGFLNERGEYLGFDPVEKGIQWCQHSISRKYPNFSFHHIPLHNDLYQYQGEQASTFIFPFTEGYWDFVMANSVFTHMIPEEIDQYLGEIKRMLSPAGRVFASFFILSEHREITNASYRFPFAKDGYSLMDEKVQSANVAIQYKFLKELIHRNGLRIIREEFGFWNSGIRGENLNFQDVLILEKATA